MDGGGRSGGGGGGGGAGHGECAVGAQDCADLRLAEDEGRALVRVLGVHGDVRGAGGEHGEDADVEVVRPGRGTYAHPVADADPGRCQPPAQPLDLAGERPVTQRGAAVVEGGLVRVGAHRDVQHVDQGARRGGRAAREQRERAGGPVGRLVLVLALRRKALRHESGSLLVPRPRRVAGAGPSRTAK